MRGLFVFLAPILLLGCTSENAKVGSRSLAEVNGRRLSIKDFSDELALRLRKYDAVLAKNPLNVSRVKDEILNDFIHESLLFSWAEKNRLSVTPDELNEYASKVQKSYPDEFAFREALAKGQRSYGEWRDSLKRLIIEKKLFAELDKKIEAPADQEMEIYFKTNEKLFRKQAQARLRQIVVSREEDAVRLQKTLSDRSLFKDLAIKYSEGPEGKQGGELGWIEKGTLEVFDKAFALPKGGLTGVLKSPYGFHIIEVLDKKADSQQTFSEARSKIRDTLLADRQQAVYAAWLEGQMKAAKVQKDPELMRSISVDTKQE